MKKTSKEIEQIMRTVCFYIRVEGRKVLKNMDISSAQFDVLQTLYFNGPKKLSDISKKLGVTKSTTTGLIKRLEILGVIEKTQSEEDKRVYMVKISDSGIELIEEVISRRVVLMEKVVNKMGNNELFIEKLSEFQKIIKEVVEVDNQ